MMLKLSRSCIKDESLRVVSWYICWIQNQVWWSKVVQKQNTRCCETMTPKIMKQNATRQQQPKHNENMKHMKIYEIMKAHTLSRTFREKDPTKHHSRNEKHGTQFLLHTIWPAGCFIVSLHRLLKYVEYSTIDIWHSFHWNKQGMGSSTAQATGASSDGFNFEKGLV